MHQVRICVVQQRGFRHQAKRDGQAAAEGLDKPALTVRLPQ